MEKRKETKETKKKIKVRDLKPKKDAKGGRATGLAAAIALRILSPLTEPRLGSIRWCGFLDSVQDAM